MRIFPLCAAILLPVALFGAAACDGGASATVEPERIFVQQACVNCHGPDRRGSMLAPALVGLAAHWNEARLVEYLSDPVGYAKKDPRLAEQAGRYSQPMPSYAGLPPEQRAALARWLLAE